MLNRPQNKRGQALVEMALMAPVLFLMVLGASDLSRLFYYSTGITNAAREGARHGAYFDFMMVWTGEEPNGEEWSELTDVLAKEVASSWRCRN